MRINGLLIRTTADIMDIYASMNNGYEQHKPALGAVKLEDFAKEFAAAF